MERLFIVFSSLFFAVFIGVFFLLRSFSLKRQIKYRFVNIYYKFLTTLHSPI
jgi:hypothetical protein